MNTTRRLPRSHALIPLALLGSTLLAVSSASATVPESEDPINIVENNWTSQLVLSRVTGNILEEMGYNVDYKSSNVQVQYAAIGSGDMHLQMEVWEGTQKDPFMEQVEADRIIDAGTHRAVTREEWWYPKYVEEDCPGLPDWEALNDCAELFAVPETAPKGRYLAGPVAWQKPDQEKVDALGLDFVIQNAGQAATLWAELDSAYRREEPILLFNWKPNWTMAAYEGEFVEFPEHEPACESDPEWGINPDATYDCGNPTDGWLKKAVWSGMPDKWSCAYQTVENIDFTNEMLANASALVDVEDMSLEEAAVEWLERNEEQWRAWVPDCAQI